MEGHYEGNYLMKEPWYESDNPDRVARAVGARAVVWIAIAVVLVGVLAIAIWGFKVATSDIKGQGDAQRQKNAATNRIAAQERFESLHAEILAADQRIGILAGAVKADPSYTNKTNLTGAQTYCLSVVADYNAEARKFTAAQFRAADLPASIDILDPATDCKGPLR